MPIGKVGKRRNVVIPQEVCDQVGLQEGDLIEVQAKRGTVIIKPKKLVDVDDTLTAAEAAVVKKGAGQLHQGKSQSNVKHALER